MSRSKVFVLMTVVMLAVLILGALPGAQAAPVLQEGADWSMPESPAEPLKVGVAMRTETQPRWQFDVASMQSMADEIGNVELLVQWAADDPVRQAAQVENLLSQGINALILVPVDDKAAIPLVDKAHQVDVPVLAYDIAIFDSDVDYFLTRDNEEVGRLQVQGALDHAPPNADDPPKYGLIKGDPDNNVGRTLGQVYDEMLAPLVEAGEVEIVTDQWHANWSGELALKDVEAALAAHNDDVQAFITSNDSMAVGVAQGVQSRGLEGQVYISGLDADVANDKLIVDGVIFNSVWTKIDEMGEHAVIAAVALALGEEPPMDGTENNNFKDVPTALVAVEAVTADYMCEWITTGAPEGWVTVEDVFGDADACAAAAEEGDMEMEAADWSIPESPAEPLKVGVAMRTETQPRWQFDVASMQSMADEIGNVELLVQWAADDPVRQAAQVENLLSQGINALILVPVDDKAAIPLVDKAHQVDVPVLAYDIAIFDSDVDYFLTRDNEEVGRLQVQGALDHAPPNADDPPKYGLIKGDPDNNVGRTLGQVYDEMLAPLVEAGEVEIVTDQWHANWSGELALKDVEAALAAHNDDVQAFITSNDSMAVGVAQGVQSRGLEGQVYISGLDADVANDKLIVDGVIFNSVWTKIDEMGEHAVIAAVALALGEEPPMDGTENNNFKDVPTALVAVEAVTADYMCEWITTGAPEGWVTVEDVFGDADACS